MSDSTSATIRCGYCGDGPFRRDVLNPSEENENVVDGYYFCMWCRRYADEGNHRSRKAALVHAAKQSTVPCEL